eukprot:Hpha_TRINITY_DN31674_c0_g1::TRINITY_DN31674_c0_g1_i1::g.29138::m.29138
MKFVQQVGSCCSGWLVREGDTPFDKRVKEIFVPVCISIAVICIINAAIIKSAMEWWVFGNIAIVLGSFIIVGWAKLGLGMATGLDIVLPIFAVSTMVVDLYTTHKLQGRMWAAVVVVLDAGLVYRRHGTVRAILGGTLVYVVVVAFESGTRVGLFDWVGDGEVPDVCQCSSPPCADGVVAFRMAVSLLFVLLADFYITRRFATGMEQQLRRTQASVEVAGEVTAALVRYDVDAAEAACRRGSDLPTALLESYSTLLSNLRSYKAYLPHSVLVPKEEEEDTDDLNDDDEVTTLHRPSDESYPAQTSDCRSPASPAFGMSALGRQTSLISVSSAGSDVSSISSILSTMLRSRPRPARVSLCCANVVGYLEQTPDLAGAANIEWISQDVEK